MHNISYGWVLRESYLLIFKMLPINLGPSLPFEKVHFWWLERYISSILRPSILDENQNEDQGMKNTCSLQVPPEYPLSKALALNHVLSIYWLNDNHKQIVFRLISSEPPSTGWNIPNLMVQLCCWSTSAECVCVYYLLLFWIRSVESRTNWFFCWEVMTRSPRYSVLGESSNSYFISLEKASWSIFRHGRKVIDFVTHDARTPKTS